MSLTTGKDRGSKQWKHWKGEKSGDLEVKKKKKQPLAVKPVEPGAVFFIYLIITCFNTVMDV